MSFVSRTNLGGGLISRKEFFVNRSGSDRSVVNRGFTSVLEPLVVQLENVADLQTIESSKSLSSNIPLYAKRKLPKIPQQE